jgi:hypothetical protein
MIEITWLFLFFILLSNYLNTLIFSLIMLSDIPFRMEKNIEQKKEPKWLDYRYVLLKLLLPFIFSGGIV